MYLKHLFKLKNYPRYINDFLFIKLQLYNLRRQGITIGLSTKFLGTPIITKKGNSVIDIGDYCLICSRSTQTALGVSHTVIIRTLNSNSSIYIGNYVRMSGTTICAAKEIIIGNNCVIGSDVIIADTDFHSLDPNIRKSTNDSHNAINNSIHIEDNVFIGTRSVILKGVTIGENSIIGAGSIVTKSFDKNSIIAGNPAKKIGEL